MFFTHDFYCINCGAMTPLPRPREKQREKFHRKRMHCWHCKHTINHIECRNQEEVKVFKRMFSAGDLREEAEEEIRNES